MNNRQRALAVLHYEDYDRLPIVHFGFWTETLEKWAQEGHLTPEQAEAWNDGNPIDAEIGAMLGFDFNWNNCFRPNTGLRPPFEERVVEEMPDGSLKILDANGAIVLRREGATGIPSEIDHLLKDRASWEAHYLPRLQFSMERIYETKVNTGPEMIRYDEGGLEYLEQGEWDNPYGLHCGSLYGEIRNWLGLVGSAYLQVDDEPLFDEIIDTVGDLCYQSAKAVLERVDTFDFAHFWEDISFKNGPLINPAVFKAKVGPHYKRITDLVRAHGIDVISLDSDGCIDALIPTWFENGVNTMFPIEVGTWGANIKPWREQYGRGLLGVGGMNKKVFAYDRSAIDDEIERLKPLVALGGYLPCPDHRIPPDAKWDNVRYYCERMRETFD
jgi:uroporphyrinogen decarboxylase